MSDPTSGACPRGLSLVHIHSLARMLWVRTPEAPPSLALAAVGVLPSPQRTTGRLLHTRSISGLLLPFTGVPAYVLPVYASSGTLPYTTQDSVPDCSLRVVRAVIADGWTVCACKAQPPPNRACRRVDRQRVALSGTFPTAPPRTDRDRFRINQLSSGLFRATLER